MPLSRASEARLAAAAKGRPNPYLTPNPNPNSNPNPNPARRTPTPSATGTRSTPPTGCRRPHRPAASEAAAPRCARGCSRPPRQGHSRSRAEDPSEDWAALRAARWLRACEEGVHVAHL